MNDGILHHGSGKEFAFRHASCVAVDLLHGGKYVVQVDGVITHNSPPFLQSDWVGLFFLRT
jgi:hypothetical protein